MHLPAASTLRLLHIQKRVAANRFLYGWVGKIASLLLVGVLITLLIGIWINLNWVSGGSFIWLFPIPVEVLLLGGFVCGQIGTSIRALKCERRNLRYEQQAFEEFKRRVQAFPVPVHGRENISLQLQSADQNNTSLRKIGDLYRETVMSIPDYDCEYGESFEEHFIAELGPDLASAVLDAKWFTPNVKRGICLRVSECVRNRQSTLDSIDLEEQSLISARSELKPISKKVKEINSDKYSDASRSELLAIQDRIQELSMEIENIIQTRQQDIWRINRESNGETEVFLQEYLYRRNNVVYPVLDCTVTYITTLKERRTLIIEALDVR